MSMPPGIHFGFDKNQSIGGTFVHFPFKEYQQWALTSGTGGNERILLDIESSLSKAQIETGAAQQEPVQPSTASAFALRVAETTTALYKSIKIPESHPSAMLTHDVLIRYKEDILSAVCRAAEQPDAAVDGAYDALGTGLTTHSRAHESSAGSDASTPGRLFELALEECISALRASEDLKVQHSVAKATYELHRRIDRLNAVLTAQDSDSPESQFLPMATRAWCSFKDDQAAEHRVEYNKVRDAYKTASQAMRTAGQRLKDACGEDEFLLTSNLEHTYGALAKPAPILQRAHFPGTRRQRGRSR